MRDPEADPSSASCLAPPWATGEEPPRASAARGNAEERLKAAKRALRIAERKYRGFFENAVEGVYQSTAEGRYLSVNPSLAKLYGYATPREMMGAIRDIARDVYFEAAMRQRFQEMIERDGEVRNLEYQVRRRDGRILWISENARVVRSRKGRVKYYEGTLRDVTPLREAGDEAAKLERQLRQAHKMEAVGTFASGIAHDFNNIVAAISGFTELALEDLPEGSLPEKYMLEVMSVSKRASELVRRILMFSRQTPPVHRTIHMAAVIDDVARMLRATLPPNIAFSREILVGDDRAVADPGQINQVLVNLCTNAIHAMRGGGGSLTIRLSDEMLGLEGSGDPRLYLKLSVGDTGHGIPDEIRERMFEPFFTTKRVEEGTGLGLSVVHGIVKGHGGDIKVSSVVGTGTTFTVFIPAGGP
jgi:two-component system, cell cycle sensor histidine kinase and response regulator CckA